MDIQEVLLIIGLLVIARWERDVIMYLIAGLVTCYIALGWMATYPGIAVAVVVLGTYCIFNGCLIALAGGSSTGLSVFKGWASKLKGALNIK